MNTLVFHNPGEIDIRGACIAGLSAKESKSPIGFFGTGLKYSIACILRWGGKIIIYAGTQPYYFKAVDLSFRGENFKQIVMESDEVERELGFTTEYGKNWKPWQVFRELYANARDEGGMVYLGDDIQLVEGETTIVVSGVSDLIEIFYERNEIIQPVERKWMFETDKVQFNSSQSGGLYYRGVRVHEQGCLFTWNFLKNIPLTEDRTLSSVITVSHFFDEFLTNDLHDIDICMQLLELKYENKETTIKRTVKFEGKPTTLDSRPVEGLFTDWFGPPTVAYDWHSYEFKQACCRLYQRNPTVYSALRAYVKSIDSKMVEDKLHVMNQREQLMFDKAKELVSIFGFAEEIRNLTIYVQELGGSTLGLYEHGTIYLSPKLFDQGTKQLVATLYEECYHHRTQNTDLTYNMQSDLFNIIISLNEEVHKVIC